MFDRRGAHVNPRWPGCRENETAPSWPRSAPQQSQAARQRGVCAPADHTPIWPGLPVARQPQGSVVSLFAQVERCHLKKPTLCSKSCSQQVSEEAPPRPSGPGGESATRTPRPQCLPPKAIGRVKPGSMSPPCLGDSEPPYCLVVKRGVHAACLSHHGERATLCKAV